MTAEQQAIFLNAIPLLALGLVYIAAALSLFPPLVRERGHAREIEYTLALFFPCGGAAALVLGFSILLDPEPIGGSPWFGLVATLIALVPAIAFFAGWRDRSLLLTGSSRVREAELRKTESERQLEAVASISNTLARSKDLEAAARLLLDETIALTDVDFAAIVVVDEASEFASGVLGRQDGRDLDWLRDLRLDLHSEPSGVASAVFEAAPFAVYDAPHSTKVSPRLVEQSNAKSVAFVPMISESRVVGVLVLATTGAHRPFDSSELGVLEAIASEAAMAMERLRSTAALGSVLEANELRLQRQAGLLKAAQRLTGELEFGSMTEILVREVIEVLGIDAADFWLFEEHGQSLRCHAVAGRPAEDVGRVTVPEGAVAEAVEQRRPILRRDLAPGERFREAMHAPIVVQEDVRGVLGVYSLKRGRFQQGDVDTMEAFAALSSLALRNAEAFEERSRQARIQRGFYRIAAVLAQSLSLPATFDALAQAASEALGGACAAALVPRAAGLELVGSYELPVSLGAALESDSPGAATTLEAAARERRILASPSLAQDDRFAGRWRELGEGLGFGSLLVIPVEAPRAEDAALVVVCFEGERRFSDEDLELARHLAGAARGALERAEQFEAERSSRTLAQQLSRTGGALATELDPAAVLDEVVEQAPALLGADACAVRVLEGGTLVVSALTGEGVDAAFGARSDAGGWLSGEVVQARGPVTVTDAARDDRFAEVDPVIAAGHSAYLGVPLIGPEGALHGVLAVYSLRPRTWRDEEVEALLALAANTSAALSNAELYQRVALEKERSTAILENIADGIVAVDREGTVVLWNRAAEHITGVPAAEALGREPQQVLQRALASGEDHPVGDRLLAIPRGGEEIWLSVTEAVMRDPAGIVAGRIFAFRDISADRLVEQMKSDFVSTVSHELRTPLTSIYGFAETMLRQDVLFGEEERRTFLGYISSESERLTRMVDALLNVARLDTGDLQVTLAPTDVRSVLSEVVANAEHGAAVTGHRFALDVPTVPLVAVADPDKLRQVVAQLVDNAVKYSEGGTVTVAARRKSESVEFAVSDEGIGIPPSEHERIFRKFYKADSALRGIRGGGTGLGLFIVQGLVSAMGGRIRVESEEGKGSTFAFELPAVRAVQPEPAHESRSGRV